MKRRRSQKGQNRKLLYRFLVLLELLVGAIGYALISNTDALAGGLVMAWTGANLLALWLVISRKGLPIRKHLSSEPYIVARLAVGNIAMHTTYVLGIKTVGIGVMVTMTALGPLFVGWRKIWAIRRTLAGVLHISVRLLAIGGVAVVSEPWADLQRMDESAIIGLLCGLVGAWSFWNYVSVFFGDRIPARIRVEVVAVADLVSLPLIALAVWVLGPIVGGGYSELWTKDALFWGVLAGIIGFTIPTIITSICADKVEASGAGAFYLADTPIANVVGLVGASIGLLPPEQEPSLWGWIGMALVVTAVGVSSALKSPEELVADLPGKGR